jgi:RNA polymerase sigma-70 factor (ECF subfamily)
VEEIVQDVFVTFWSKAPSLDPAGNVKAYLYAILRNNILHELRTEHTRSFYMQKLKTLPAVHEEGKSLQNIYVQEVEEYIRQVITTLSPQCREAFSLSRFEHLSYKEIAARMHLSTSTVEKHVAKALRVLRHKLHEYSDVSFMLLLFFISWF